jgi:hypothetical protein
MEQERVREGCWYRFDGDSLQLKKGTKVRVVEPVSPQSDGAMVWPMGPGRTEDEAGIWVLKANLRGPGVSSAPAVE